MATISQTSQRLYNLSLRKTFLYRLPIVFPSKTFSRRSFSIAMDRYSNVLSEERMNPNIIKMEYAVRGVVPMRAKEIARELQQV